MLSVKKPNESKTAMVLEDADSLNNLDNVSKRLKYVVDTLGVKQSHLAQKLGLSASGLHYILNNDTRFSKNAKKIAAYLKVNEPWLATDARHTYEENKSIKTYKIPLYYPDQLKLYFHSDKKNNLTTDNFMLTPIAYSNKSIGIYLTETDFSPKFEVGDKMVFEETETFIDGEILLIYLSKFNNIFLKYGFQTGSEIILISPAHNPIKLLCEHGDAIIGAYRECLKTTHLT